jgi:Glycosyltransferase family 87
MAGRRVRSGVLEGPRSFDAGTSLAADDAVYAPSRFDPVARAASTVIGGPAGRRLASAGGFWRAAPVLVLLACVMLSFGLVQKQHCRAQGWSTPDQFWHACYSDIPVLYSSAQLGAAHPPSLMHQLRPGSGLSQAPLPGALMWVMASVTPNHGNTAGRVYFDASAALLAFLLVVAVAAVAVTARRRSWDAAHLALSPVLITAGLISYELLGVAVTALALLALSRGRTLLSGALVGLAIACAPQLALIALAVAVLSRRHLRNGAGVVLAVTAAASWFVVRVALLPGYTGGLSDAFSGWHKAVPGYGSLWLVPQLLKASHPRPAASLLGRGIQGIFGWLFAGDSLSGHTASILAVVLLIILGGVVIGLTVVAGDAAEAWAGEGGEFGAGEFGAGRFDAGEFDAVGDAPEVEVPALESSPAPQTEVNFAEFVTTRVAPLSLALVAAALITAKSLPVQVSLLLLPLIALTGLRWRDHLIWAATELVYFVGVWLYIGGESIPNRGLPASFYVILLVARLAGIAWVGVQGILIFRAADQACGQPDGGPSPVDKISALDDDAGRLLVDRGVSAPHHAG